jgi:hypothetical protein
MRHALFIPSGHCTSSNLRNTPLYSSVRGPVLLHMTSGALTTPTASFLSIIPLAKVRVRSTPPVPLIVHHAFPTPQLLAFATEELSIRVGETLAGLINATLVCTSFRLVFPSRGSPKLFAWRVTRECSRQRRLRHFSNHSHNWPRVNYHQCRTDCRRA